MRKKKKRTRKYNLGGTSIGEQAYRHTQAGEITRERDPGTIMEGLFKKGLPLAFSAAGALTGMPLLGAAGKMLSGEFKPEDLLGSLKPNMLKGSIPNAGAENSVDIASNLMSNIKTPELDLPEMDFSFNADIGYKDGGRHNFFGPDADVAKIYGGSLFYGARPYYFKDGGIYIKPKNKGKFTAAAQRVGKGVQEYAKQIMANPDNYSSTLVKRANFAKNAAGWNKNEYGGEENADFEVEGGETLTWQGAPPRILGKGRLKMLSKNSAKVKGPKHGPGNSAGVKMESGGGSTVIFSNNREEDMIVDQDFLDNLNI